MGENLTPEERALERYLRRKNRQEKPQGRYDNGGRWWPDEEEIRPCCRNIRRPSRAWPFTLLDHCRTLAHCCALEGADLREAMRLLRRHQTLERLAEGRDKQ